VKTATGIEKFIDSLSAKLLCWLLWLWLLHWPCWFARLIHIKWAKRRLVVIELHKSRYSLLSQEFFVWKFSYSIFHGAQSFSRS